MSKQGIGQKKWAFSAGNIPVESTGKEPDFVGQDRLSILNTSTEDALIKLTIYFSDQQEVGEYSIRVKAERVRKFRINDLIDPHAIPLGVPYGGHIESNVPVVVQFSKQNSGQHALALMGTTAYANP